MLQTDLWDVVARAQKHIAKYYAGALVDESKKDDLRAYIEKFIADNRIIVEGYTAKQLVDRIYSEMVEYSVLTPYLGSPLLDEINVNSWDDITLTYSDGRMQKLPEHFRDPTHAVDIVKRLLHHSNMIIDNAAPIAQGHLPNNTRGLRYIGFHPIAASSAYYPQKTDRERDGDRRNDFLSRNLYPVWNFHGHRGEDLIRKDDAA